MKAPTLEYDPFEQIRQGLLNLDPVWFAEKYLTLDGKPFRLNGNGYKPFLDIYRYIGIKALERDSKPVVLVKGRQVGATTMASVLELYFMASGLFGTAGRPPIRVMHCFPQLELAYAYTKTKLNTMISSAVSENLTRKAGKTKNIIESKLDKNAAASDSLHLKQFENGNHVWIDSLGLDANRIRGRTCDVMLVDEVQDAKGPAISNGTKILSKAQYGRIGDGVQVYFGTPKQAGTEYWKMWKDSSQQYYYLGCENCTKLFPLYTPGSDEWEKIWIHGYIVRCPHCQHEQDKREAAERGKWVSLNNDPNCTFIGYHINQLYMPDFTREKIEKEKPANSAVNTERAYMNEVLGEFYAGSSAPITQDEIERNCADMNRKFTAAISPGEGRKVYAGFDWGQKADLDQLAVGEHGPRQQGQSFSCGVIITADGPNILSIEFATRLKRNDMSYKKETVEEMFRRYSVDLAVGDIGYANDLTYVLQKEHGDKFLASRAVNRVKNHIRFDDSIFPKEVQFERDYYIAELYSIMKDGKMRFPFGDFEKVSFLIDHCCSMEIKATRDASGEVRQRYVKGSTPNDGFMALLNAYLAYKFDITDGFSLNNPNMMRSNPNERKPLPAILSFLPGLFNRR